MTEEEAMALARLHRGNQDWEAFSHFSQVGLLTFVRAIEQASRRAALEEAANTAVERLKSLTTEMEGYSYFGSNPGVKEDDYEDVAEAIRFLVTGDKA